MMAWERLKLGCRFERGDYGERGIKGSLIQNVKGIRPQAGDQLAHHHLNELVRQGLAKGCPQFGAMRVNIARRRIDHVVARRWLTDPRRAPSCAFAGGVW